MASTLGCIGLEVDGLDTLNEHLAASTSRVVGRTGDVESVLYSDDSGARVVLALDANGATLDLVPSYDARPGALLAGLAPLGPVVAADVLDEDGRVATRAAFDLEQSRHLEGLGEARVRASVVALGLEMGVYADKAAFDASEHSRLGGSEPGGSEPGEEPLRFGHESFLSYGLFGAAETAEPTAFLSGTVLSSDTQTHGATGQVFHVARVRTVGFEATVCLAGSAHPSAPEPGSIVAGSCYLVVDAPSLWVVEPPRRRRRKDR